MKQVLRTTLRAAVLGMLLLAVSGAFQSAGAQGTYKWMSAGSLHSWFSIQGCEIEVGRASNADQQDGLQWPAFYQYQDMEAAKGLWIGATNYTDSKGISWPYKVVHVGPRVNGKSEFFPVTFEMTSKFDLPDIQVDGSPSIGKQVDNNKIDATMKPDRMITNVVNTAIGITMTRKIMQFSQPYHDNYFIYDYTFTNTGNINADAAIELPNQTLSGLYFYWMYRYSPTADVRYVIGNPTSWGYNAMDDTRGDGVKPDPPGQQFRAQYTWHGKLLAFTQYDNLFGPIWTPYYDKTDTLGRIGAPQFVGHATLFASKSAVDSTDDPGQPSTTSWEGSDDPRFSGNDQFNNANMTEEYTKYIARGHRSPRHADAVQPDGNFDVPTGDPSQGTTGGFSSTDGYGPYTLGPGQSVHIVMVEGANGISREVATRVGHLYKIGAINAKAKNDSCFTGRDSLFMTFNRAMQNYKSGYTIPSAPLPPRTFAVTSGDPINLAWDVYGPDPNLKGFRIYRASGRYDQPGYELIHEAGASDRSFDDRTAIRGVAYFYYIVSVGDPAQNTGVGATPAGALTSNRIWTQTYNAAYLKLKRPPGGSMQDIRIVPNPYNISSDATNLRFDGEPDKIAFFNIPGQCRIRIFTELGEQIAEINHTDGSGDAYWNSLTSSNQIIVSGIYIVLFEDLTTGDRIIRKLSVIR